MAKAAPKKNETSSQSMKSTTPNVTWNATTHIAVQPELLFHYLADFTSTRNWDPSVTDGALMTEGAIGEGSAFQLEFTMAGITRLFHYTVIDYQPPQRITLRSTSDGYTIVDTILIEPDLANPFGSMVNYSLSLSLKRANPFSVWCSRQVLHFFAGKALKSLQRLPLTHSGRVKSDAALLSAMIVPKLIQFTRFGFFRMKNASQPMPMGQQGLQAVLTGCTSGIGQEIAIELARAGVELIMVNRSATKATALAQQLRSRFNTPVHSYIADLSNIQQTIQTAQQIKQDFASIDILINNAGELLNERQITPEGFERNCAVLLIAPFAMIQTLLPSLMNKPNKQPNQSPARVINMCSGGLYAQALHLDDLHYEQGAFNGAKAYARAKRGLLDITEQLARVYDKNTIIFHGMHPGWVHTPGVEKSLASFYAITKSVLRTAYQGADTAIWLALSQSTHHLTGLFWLDRKKQVTSLWPSTKTAPSDQARLVKQLETLIHSVTTSTADQTTALPASKEV